MQKPKISSLFVVLFAITIIFGLLLIAGNSANAIREQNEEQNQAQNQGEEQQLQEQNQEQNQEGDENADDIPEPNLISVQEKSSDGKNATISGQINAQEHRSTVANFVQNLLKVASTTAGGIGEQVRVIAQQQNQSATTTIQAVERVQTRNKIRTFLFGSDYKNLGALRSEMVQTRNRLDQLNRIMTNMQNASDTAEIQAQIQTLEQEQERIENFIREQEGKFSLFGWLAKLINGYKNLTD